MVNLSNFEVIKNNFLSTLKLFLSQTHTFEAESKIEMLYKEGFWYGYNVTKEFYNKWIKTFL